MEALFYQCRENNENIWQKDNLKHGNKYLAKWMKVKKKKKTIMFFADMKTHPFHGQILAASEMTTRK